MNVGRLRHRVKLQSKSVTRNDFGEEVVTWTDTATVWAEVSGLSGREYITQSRTEAELSHRVRIRYRASIVPHMRVLVGTTQALDIEAVLPDERKREIQLMCKEIVA
jgi:SPP1 family predicted phage head-tail adaptor